MWNLLERWSEIDTDNCPFLFPSDRVFSSKGNTQSTETTSCKRRHEQRNWVATGDACLMLLQRIIYQTRKWVQIEFGAKGNVIVIS